MHPDPAIERAIAALARRQHGVFTRAQLCRVGLTPAMLRHRLGCERLYRVHRGVYAVADPAVLALASESAALLAVGERAVLSHRSAAAVWSLAEPDPKTVDVTNPGAGVRLREGVKVHRVRALAANEVRVRAQLRVTAPARTLVDFAAQASAGELERALAEARVARLLTDRDLKRALSAAPERQPGSARLRGLLRRQAGRAVTRSEAERKFLALIESTHLPAPRVNVMVHGFLVDFFWPESRLAVEVDGYAFHGSRPAFRRDRRRDRVMNDHGIQVMRVTWEDMDQGALAMVASLTQAVVLRAAEYECPR